MGSDFYSGISQYEQENMSEHHQSGGELVAPHSFFLVDLLVWATVKGWLQNSAPGAQRDSHSRTPTEDTLGAEGGGVQ